MASKSRLSGVVANLAGITLGALLGCSPCHWPSGALGWGSLVALGVMVIAGLLPVSDATRNKER